MLSENDVIRMQVETMYGGIPSDLHENGEYALLVALSFIFFNYEKPYFATLSIIKDCLSKNTPDQINDMLNDFPDTRPGYNEAQQFVHSSKFDQLDFINGLLHRLG